MVWLGVWSVVWWCGGGGYVWSALERIASPTYCWLPQPGTLYFGIEYVTICCPPPNLYSSTSSSIQTWPGSHLRLIALLWADSEGKVVIEMVVDEEVGEELFLMSILDSLDTPDSSIVRWAWADSRLRPFLRSHTAALSRDQPGTSGRDGEIWKFEKNLSKINVCSLTGNCSEVWTGLKG